MAPPDIYWTPDDGDDSDLIPGHLTQVINAADEIRIGFAGQEGAQGDQYHGILRIRLRTGLQTVEGKQSYKTFDGPWEKVRFSVVGKFEDDRFTTFGGIWKEGGKTYRVGIVGLSVPAKAVPNRARTSRSRASPRRKGSRAE